MPATLTTSNLQKYTAHETPRTKVLRYFNQVENPPSPIIKQTQIAHLRPQLDPWQLAKQFLPGIKKSFEADAGPCESPVLGRKERPLMDREDGPGMMKSAFESEDSDLLVYIPPKPTHLNRFLNKGEEDNASDYSWSESRYSTSSKGVPFWN